MQANNLLQQQGHFSNQISCYNKDLNRTHNSMNDNFTVVVRVRPPLEREVQNGRFISTVQTSPDHTKICLFEYYNLENIATEQLQMYFEDSNNYSMHQFTFDYVYDQESSQQEVYDNTAKHAVLSSLEGFNASIIAYGQTSTGKTFTMQGFTYSNQDPLRGIIPRSIDEIFKYIENCSNSKATFMVRCSYLQIYNEVISDLLRPDRQSLQIREDKKRGIFVEGLSEWAVRSPSEIYSLMKKGASSRATAETKLNDVSSRSHAVFIITIEQMIYEEDQTELFNENPNPKHLKIGKLNLVDLAGSERVSVTLATGKRLEECKKINQSLSALGNVIAALTDLKGLKHIPYRDSKITRLLENSLGGNCKTTLMGMISPAIDAFNESLSTLKFANRAKNIKNTPIVNEDLDQRALLRTYEEELKRLKLELDEKNKLFVDKHKLFQLQEEKLKAEQDKNAVLAAYEERSKEFFQEREDKKKLEEKIGTLSSQLLIGGRKIEDTPQFRSALEEQQKLIREQYEQKLGELEKERKQIEESKVQVDRYKQLLLKQRDIMIALTSRLNERDDTIIQLQEELDAYDRIHKETESVLENRNARVKILEQELQNHSIQIPAEVQLPVKSEHHNQGAISKTRSNDMMHICNLTYFQRTTQIPSFIRSLEGETLPFNVTQKNLEAEEKINELTQTNEKQKQEIETLKQEIDSIKEHHSKFDLEESMKQLELEYQQKVYGLQKKYEEELGMLTENAKKYEKSQSQFLDLIQLKDLEIQKLQVIARNSNGSDQKLSDVYQMNQALKGLVDNIVTNLSQPNDTDQLKTVAKDFITLQTFIQQILTFIKKSQNTSPSTTLNNSMQQQHQQGIGLSNSNHNKSISSSSSISQKSSFMMENLKDEYNLLQSNSIQSIKSSNAPSLSETNAGSQTPNSQQKKNYQHFIDQRLDSLTSSQKRKPSQNLQQGADSKSGQEDLIKKQNLHKHFASINSVNSNTSAGVNNNLQQQTNQNKITKF